MMDAARTKTDLQSYRDRIVRPIFIVSTPRSGSTLLFETLVKAPGLFTVGAESHERIECVADFFPGRRGWESNRLTGKDAAAEAIEELAQRFYSALRDREGKPPQGSARLVEKTPKNALRVPFFDAAWNDSVFIYLYRDPRETLASMIEGWSSGRFVTYPALPGWGAPRWSFLLVPGWRELIGQPIAETVARQWATTTEILLDDLSKLPSSRVFATDYAALVADPQATVSRLARGADLQWDVQLPTSLPFSRMTLSRPSRDKWKRFAADIARIWPIVEAADMRARAFVGAAAH